MRHAMRHAFNTRVADSLSLTGITFLRLMNRFITVVYRCGALFLYFFMCLMQFTQRIPWIYHKCDVCKSVFYWIHEILFSSRVKTRELKTDMFQGIFLFYVWLIRRFQITIQSLSVLTIGNSVWKLETSAAPALERKICLKHFLLLTRFSNKLKNV